MKWRRGSCSARDYEGDEVTADRIRVILDTHKSAHVNQRGLKPMSCCLMADALEALLPIVEELATLPHSSMSMTRRRYLAVETLIQRAREALQ